MAQTRRPIRKLASAIAALALVAGSAGAQTYKVPRNGFGQPDFSGTWTNASITQLERPAQFKSLVISPTEARTLEQAYAQAVSADAKPTDPKAGAPSAGADPGGYNTFWIDPGTKVGAIRGQLRSSWLTEPADGKLPYSAEGRRLFMTEVRKISGAADDPEYRQLAERCLLGFGSTAGPPMLNVLYNNTYQIQQNADHVVILVEMDHDARIVRLISPAQILYEFKVEDPTAYTKTWRGEMPLNATHGPVYEYACHEGNYALPSILRGARRAEEAARNPAGPGGAH